LKQSSTFFDVKEKWKVISNLYGLLRIQSWRTLSNAVAISFAHGLCSLNLDQDRLEPFILQNFLAEIFIFFSFRIRIFIRYKKHVYAKLWTLSAIPLPTIKDNFSWSHGTYFACTLPQEKKFESRKMINHGLIYGVFSVKC
jgi:hypothetical protein